MYTLTLPGGPVLLHDSPETLPEYRRAEHNYYSLVDSAIGSTLADVDKHLEKITLLTQAGETDAAKVAIDNFHHLRFNIKIKQIAPNLLALCCLVESVEGVTWTDYSSKGVESLARKLSELGINQEIIKNTAPVYEEILDELRYQYPKFFPDKTEEINTRTAQALLLQIDETLNPDDPGLPERRKSLEYELIESIKPPVMVNDGNAPDAIRKNYRSNRNAFQSEGWPVNDMTSSTDFWGYVSDFKTKYKPNTSKPRNPEE